MSYRTNSLDPAVINFIPDELLEVHTCLLQQGWKACRKGVLSDYDYLWRKPSKFLVSHGTGEPLHINIKAYDFSKVMRVDVQNCLWVCSIGISDNASDDVWTEVVVRDIYADELLSMMDSQIEKLSRAWNAINDRDIIEG